MTASASKPTSEMTASAFLDWVAGRRFELVDGITVAMAPGTALHAKLQAQLALLIGQHLKRQAGPCWVGTEPGVQPRAQSRHNVRVPDLAVSCTPVGPSDRVMRDPILIVEILSPSNTKDTRSNVLAYTSIPTVKEILIVDTSSRRLEVLCRDADGTWPDDPTAHLGAGRIVVASIGLELDLADVYSGTHLSKEP